MNQLTNAQVHTTIMYISYMGGTSKHLKIFYTMPVLVCLCLTTFGYVPYSYTNNEVIAIIPVTLCLSYVASYVLPPVSLLS